VRPSFTPLALLLTLPAWGCLGDRSTEGGESPPQRGEAPAIQAAPPPPVQVFDREFLFIAGSPDSVVQLPWFFRSRVLPGGVLREHRAWLARDGSWETLADEESETPPTRIPWRVVPGERIRLVVDEENRIASLLFRDPPRELETAVGGFLTEWIRPGAESVVLSRGETRFPSGPVDGFLLDITRRWETPSAPGEWIFLHAGDEVQFFLEELVPLQDPRHPSLNRGWSRVGSQESQWSGITMTWEDLRPFERARRDIPGGWSFASPGGEVAGDLIAENSHLAAGEGDGPILPVYGLFSVRGTLRIEGQVFDVVGTVRHVQP
jgi:hypothetical protein